MRTDYNPRATADELLALLGAPQPGTYIFGFRYPGLHGRECSTDLMIWREGQVPLVIATERPDNPGASITNTAEQLAERIALLTGWTSPGDFLLVEHYPPGRGTGPLAERTLCLVDFAEAWAGVTWRHLPPTRWHHFAEPVTGSIRSRKLADEVAELDRRYAEAEAFDAGRGEPLEAEESRTRSATAGSGRDGRP